MDISSVLAYELIIENVVVLAVVLMVVETDEVNVVMVPFVFEFIQS
jgi:hypothetical protein